MSTNASPGTVNDFLMEQLTCTTIGESITAQEVTNFKTSVILGMTPEQMGHAATHLINFELVVCLSGVYEIWRLATQITCAAAWP